MRCRRGWRPSRSRAGAAKWRPSAIATSAAARTPSGVDPVNHADDQRADGGSVVLEQLPCAIAFAIDEHEIPGAGGARAINGNEAGPHRPLPLVDRLDDHQAAPGKGRVLGRGRHGPQHFAERHASTESTMPTMALSTGTKCGSSASAASRAPTRYTRSFRRADTVSTATSGGADGCRRWSTGWTMSRRLPCNPSYLRSQTTVPITSPRYIPGDLLQRGGEDQRDLHLGVVAGVRREAHSPGLALEALAQARAVDVWPADRHLLHRAGTANHCSDENLPPFEGRVLLHLLLNAELECGLCLRHDFGDFRRREARAALLRALPLMTRRRSDVCFRSVRVKGAQIGRGIGALSLGAGSFRGLRRRGDRLRGGTSGARVVRPLRSPLPAGEQIP